ncbi:unnamed protein product [Arabidopsis arenosa]|uniref:Uncharacterized protein n=1 Tax=Arabidopsis arenosa TaxID=38785 RepID=A0A8S2ANQ5_ARAAE|nr:unnamed protein product [Arabidopsis arenosa]
MAPILRSTSLFALIVCQISLIFLFASTLPISSGSESEDSYTITGRVRIPASTVIGHAAKFSNIKVILNGGQHVTFLRPDGYFTFHKVPAGTHLIEVYAMGYFFSPVRVDVSARHRGKVQATLTETRRSLTELVLEPLRAEQYYEMREPFSVMSIVKSPMGLMVGFMVVVVFLMPKLMENIDPEEMKSAQEQMRSQGVPSLTSLIDLEENSTSKFLKRSNIGFTKLMESLPTTVSAKSDRRGRPSKSQNTSKPSLILAFFSCLAWLYVAGRLWQDAQYRAALNTVLKKNYDQRPKVLTVEDKLVVLGCKDLERRIVETEMELAQAKSQGYLKNQKSVSSSGKKMLAVIGVYTGFGSHLKRNKFRGSWMPRDDALKKLEERGVVIRFVIGRSANRGDSLDRKIDEENRATKDFLILENHEEAQEELPKKVKFFYSAAVQNWDAEFYVKVDDNVDLDLEGMIGLLESRRGQDGAYIGCMKSGDVITEEGSQWYEPEWWKFGDDKSYFRHATGSLVILSKNLAQYVNINSGLLKTYAFDDTTIGSWMIGVQATYIDDNRLCCSSTRQEKVCSMA